MNASSVLRFELLRIRSTGTETRQFMGTNVDLLSGIFLEMPLVFNCKVCFDMFGDVSAL